MKRTNLAVLLLATSLGVGAFSFAINTNKPLDFNSTYADGVYNCALPAGYSELSVICNIAVNTNSNVINTHKVRGTVTRSASGNTYIQRVNQTTGKIDSILLTNCGISYTAGNVLDIEGGVLNNTNGVPYLDVSDATIEVSFSTNPTGFEPTMFDSALEYINEAFNGDTYPYSQFVEIKNVVVAYQEEGNVFTLKQVDNPSYRLLVEATNNDIKNLLNGYYISGSNLDIKGNLSKNGDNDVLKISQTSDITIYDYNLRNVQDTTILQAFNWSLPNIDNELENIKNAGFKTIQVSPMQPQTRGVDVAAWGDQYWKLYQPLGFEIAGPYQNVLGDRNQLETLVEHAKEKGINIIVDVILNHLAGSNESTFNSDVRTFEQQIYDNKDTYIHNYKGTHSRVDDTQEGTVRGSLGDYPDLDTSNAYIQSRAIHLLKEYIDCGVRGFRFDAAKHIETPSDGVYASDFWPNVLGAATDYATSNYGYTPYYYGEILGPGNNRSMDWYTGFMSTSDPATISNFTDKVRDNDVNIDGNYGYNLPSNKVVIWPESHDNYVSGSPSQAIIDKTYAVQASRQSAASLFLARPYDESTKMGSIGSVEYKSALITAYNKFHNELYDASEWIKKENGYFINVRHGSDRNGAMIVNISGSGSGSINLNVGEGFGIPDGTYIDLTNESPVTVSGGYVTANFGSDDVMALLQITKSGAAINDGYGLRFGNGRTVLAIDLGEKDYGGRDQYKIVRQSFKKDDTFSLYNFFAKESWVIDVDGWSFGGDAEHLNRWEAYLSKGATSYTVLQDFTADIYLKFKFEDDQIYFDLAGLSLSKYSAELAPEETDTVTVSHYAGSYSAISSNVSVATVNKDGDTITITGVSDGSATITVTDGVVTRNISVTVTTPPETNEITLYFSNNKNWNNLKVYIWSSIDGSKPADWPGSDMTFVRNNEYGEAIYSITIDLMLYDRIIFNGSGNQTVDIDISGKSTNDAFYLLDTKDGSGHYNIGTYTFGS